ncbi:MAG: beta-propeller domain-containing protein [bacterium]
MKAAPASLRVTLPKDYAKSSWRATGTKITTSLSKKKYPNKFYAGKKTFGETLASSYTKDAQGGAISSSGGVALTATAGVVNSPSVAASRDAKTTSSSASVEESDIWKADGSKVYFFNQLRGLQVLDLTDPADPTLMASYRLPAKGQDMYIVSGPGAVRYAILLTREYEQGSWVQQTGVQVIKVNGSSAKLVSSLKVEGWLADSRLVGTRIYLATQQWSWSSSANTDAVTLNDIVLNTTSGSVTLAKTHAVKGNWPVISAGNDWLTVTQSDWSDWQSSWITLFSLGTNGATQLTVSPIKLFGRLDNKYYVQYENGILSTVSQRGWWNDQQVILENFNSGGSKMGSVEIMKNESLMSARFAGDKAYVVTFRQTDPLFVVDLSNATNPVIAGHLEVPGFSTHIEPIGDKLFTIGFDGGKVAASLFDVSDPAKPTISTNGRIILDGTWGYSAATYDDKALKVLPENGLALIPYTSYDSSTGSNSSYIQILKMDVAAGKLSKGGVITHRFDPLRATLVNGALASISQKELVTASLPSNGDPSLLSDLLLAWPVNRILMTANHLIQIEEGASPSWWGWYGSGAATARVSPQNDPDSGLTEIPLGKGVVKDAILRGSSLYILRQNPDNATLWGWGRAWSSPTSQTDASPTLFLDIYDASRLPDLKLSGSTSLQLPGNDSAWDLSGLLIPSAKSAVVVAQPQARNYRWGGYLRPQPIILPDISLPLAVLDRTTSTVTMTVTNPSNNLVTTTTNTIVAASVGSVSSAKLASSPMIASCMPYPFDGYQPPQSTNPAIAVVFQTENPSAPVAQPVIPLTDTNSTPVVSPAAAGGMLVYGYAVKEKPLADGTELSTCQHALRILDLNDPATPILGPALALPGRLAGVSDITTDGFLAWTQTSVKGASGDGQVQVSACDVASLTQITGITLKNSTAVAAVGRTLFAVQGKDVARYSLNDSGVLAGTGKVTFDWQPSSLRISTNPTSTLLGADSQNLFTWSYNDPKAQVLDWATERPVDVLKASVLTNRSVLAPAGEYGVDEYLP